MDCGNPTKFTAPEFSKIFQRIKEKEFKEGFYCVRQLNKFHQEQFEDCIDSAQVEIENLRSLTGAQPQAQLSNHFGEGSRPPGPLHHWSLTTSKFADKIRYLTVRIPEDLIHLDELCYASPKFFLNIQKVNVIFTKAQRKFERKKITISEKLFFRGLNVISENYAVRITIYCYNSRNGICQCCHNSMNCYYDVQIIDSNFDGVGLYLRSPNRLIVQNSSFKNVPENFTLNFDTRKNWTTIDNVQFFNCANPLIINYGNNIVSINKLRIKKCTQGCYFYQINRGELKLNDVEIVDCETGMMFYGGDNSVIQNCSIIGALKIGIWLRNSTVQYQQIFINQSDKIKEEFKKIDSEDSTFTEIL